MTFEVLNPSWDDGAATADFALAERLASLRGMTVGIVSNGKQGTGRFFDALSAELVEQHGVASIVREVKSNYSAPADADILDRAKTWNALISGIGD